MNIMCTRTFTYFLFSIIHLYLIPAVVARPINDRAINYGFRRKRNYTLFPIDLLVFRLYTMCTVMDQILFSLHMLV